MTEKQERLRVMASMPGWVDFVEMANDMRQSHLDIITYKLNNDPDGLTDKAAIATSNRARGISDLLDAVDSEIRASQPDGQRNLTGSIKG